MKNKKINKKLQKLQKSIRRVEESLFFIEEMESSLFISQLKKNVSKNEEEEDDEDARFVKNFSIRKIN